MRKLQRPTDQRTALLKNLATNLLWYGRIETTLEKAKDIQSYAEKLLTIAINTYEDTVKTTKKVVSDKGATSTREVINDGPKKLAARRKIMSKVYTVVEPRKPGEKKADYVARIDNIKYPLIEKIFNVLAPKYDARAKELGQKGGYTRIIKLGKRKGDNAEMCIIELI
jgi:large subunit ribosomal protein L17